MKVKILLTLLGVTATFFLFLIPQGAGAFGLNDLWDVLERSYEKQVGIDTTTKDELEQIKKLLAGLTGTHQYGSLDNDSSLFAWGKKSGDWQELLNLYKNSDDGALSKIESTYAKQFPIKESLGSDNEIENKYYLLQAQTALASRSSSQLAYEQISKESDVVETLQKQIDKAQDNKSAVDLNNRLLVEQNKLSIQQAKMTAILIQQAAIEAQEKTNQVKENSEFFDIK